MAMVAPNPEDVLTSRIREALRALLAASLKSPAPHVKGPRSFHPRDAQQEESHRILASVILGHAWAPQLLSTAITRALELFVRHEQALAEFVAAVRCALGEAVPHLDRMVDDGDLDRSAPDLELVRAAAEGGTPAPSIARAVEVAAILCREGRIAPRKRRYEADCRTPYSVPVDAPTVFAAVIRPFDYDEGEWEYELGSLSPDLATLRTRIAESLGDDDDLVGYAEVHLEPATDTEGSRQTDICDAAIRVQNGVASYDLHSFLVAGAGISEVVTDYPIEPHPAGPIARTATVRLTLVRHIPLDAGA
jgi:hypothetical protein